jgi:hypothetical protein
MGRNVIVSEETLRDLLEAHASLSAWYYEHSRELASKGISVRPPDDAARASFVAELPKIFPELAQLAGTIKVPRQFVPPPPRVSIPPPPLVDPKRSSG